MQEPRISVIMLTYNREKLVGRAVESIMNQTFKDFEFIIVDNGSTDSSGAIVDAYAAKDSRLRIIHRERGNIGAGRNTGLDAAKGEYITFIDDDDWAEPDFLEFLLNLAVENEAEISMCGAFCKNFDEKLVMNTEEALITLMWRKYYNVQFPTKLLKRELFKNLRFPETGLYDDIALMYKTIAEAKRVVYYGLPKYSFYRHENNNSAWTMDHSLLTLETLNEYLQAYRERTEWLGGLFPGRAAAFRYFELSFMISMVEKITRFDLKDCYTRREDLVRELRENSDEFLNGEFALDFEKEWFRQYI